MTDMRLDDDPLSPTYGDVIYDNTGATTTLDQAECSTEVEDKAIYLSR